MSIKLRLVIAVLASMLILTFATAAIVRHVSERSIDSAARQAVASAARALEHLERGDVEKLDTALSALQAHPGLTQSFVARDREKLLALASPIFRGMREQHDVTHWYFLDPEPQRTCFLRVHKPAQFGDVVGRATLTRAIESKGLGAGKELGRTAFALRVVRPWVAEGKLVGYMELGEEIDHFLGRMKAQTGDDYGLLVEKKYLDAADWANARAGKRNNWDDQPNAVVVDTTTGEEGIITFAEGTADLPDTGRVLEEVERGGRVLVRGIVPVRDASGRKVGALFVLHDITPLHQSMTQSRNVVVLLFVLVAVLLSITLVLTAQRLVFRRLQHMTATLEDLSARLAGGDYEAGKDFAPKGKDEIAAFESFFAQFLQVLGGLLRELQARARRTG